MPDNAASFSSKLHSHSWVLLTAQRTGLTPMPRGICFSNTVVWDVNLHYPPWDGVIWEKSLFFHFLWHHGWGQSRVTQSSAVLKLLPCLFFFQGLFFKKKKVCLCDCTCVCTRIYMYVCTCKSGTDRIRKRRSEPPDPDLQMTVSIPCGCWELNSSSLVDVQLLLITELSLQPLQWL